MTDGTNRSTAAQNTERRTMGDVEHTNPNTGETFGTVYRRGPAVADGGAKRAGNPARGPDPNHSRESMADVDHESANEDVCCVWDRGLEETSANHVPGVARRSGATGSDD
ncbi:MAG: hypothetical protein V5A46_08155 [Haloferacaceae archaeon]